MFQGPGTLEWPFTVHGAMQSGHFPLRNVLNYSFQLQNCSLSEYLKNFVPELVLSSLLKTKQTQKAKQNKETKPLSVAQALILKENPAVFSWGEHFCLAKEVGK